MLAFLVTVLTVAAVNAVLAYALSFAHLAWPVGRRVGRERLMLGLIRVGSRCRP